MNVVNKKMFSKSSAAFVIALIICNLCQSTLSQFVSSNDISSQNRPTVSDQQEALRQISIGSEKFSLDLFRSLVKEANGANVIISPFSIWSLLILMAEGAVGNTYKELSNVLGLPDDLRNIGEAYVRVQRALRVNTPTVEIAIDQALFYNINQRLDLLFEHRMKEVYEADLEKVDFSMRNEAYWHITDYITKKTKGKIDRIITQDDLINAQMLLVSAIYFKGQWKFPFNRTYTEVEKFYTDEEVLLTNVPMMYQRGMFPYAGIKALNAHVLELPYGREDRLSMILILPRRNVRIQSVIDILPSYSIAFIMNELKKAALEFDEEEVEVYLPRFNTTSDFTLNGVLQIMGLKDIFDTEKADLTKMSRGDIYLSKIVHKSKIEVTEEGTVATAATGATFTNKSAPPKFYANRPFLYLIIEKTTNLILFCGQITNPNLGR